MRNIQAYITLSGTRIFTLSVAVLFALSVQATEMTGNVNMATAPTPAMTSTSQTGSLFRHGRTGGVAPVYNPSDFSGAGAGVGRSVFSDKAFSTRHGRSLQSSGSAMGGGFGGGSRAGGGAVTAVGAEAPASASSIPSVSGQKRLPVNPGEPIPDQEEKGPIGDVPMVLFALLAAAYAFRRTKKNEEE